MLFPSQHPLGQELASQRQLPPTQCCPTEQAEPLPQRHCPLAQLSAEAGLQLVQEPPAVPHALNSLIRQISPSQHPLWQERP